MKDLNRPNEYMKGVVEIITGSGAKKARKQQARALAEQREQQATQDAIQKRQQIRLDDEEADASGALASRRRAVAARRRGRGALSFTSSSNLKTSLGE